MSWQALNWCAGLHQVRGPRRAVLWALSNRHNARNGIVSMGLTAIAAEAGLSRSVAHRTIRALADEGLVLEVLKGRGPNSVSLYALPAVTVPSERDGSQGLSTAPPIQPATVPSKRDSSPNHTVPPERDSDEITPSDPPSAAKQPSHPGGTEPSHFKPQPSHPGGTFHITKKQPALDQDQDRTVVTQEPAAALAPDGAAAKQQGGLSPQARAELERLKADLKSAKASGPSPNGRDPPTAATQ